MQDRLKREFRQDATGSGDDASDDDDLFGDSKLAGEGKKMKKVLKKNQKGDAYDSDKESNPYASSVRAPSPTRRSRPLLLPIS